MNLEEIRSNPYKNLARYALPSVVGMLLTSMITVVDGTFISNNVGNQGLAAINLGLPILYLFLGITIMLGVGGSTLAIKKLGAGDVKGAGNNFMMTTTITAGVVLLLAAGFRILLPVILGFFDIVPQVQDHLLEYYNLILFFYPLMMLNIVAGMFIRGEGKPQIFMLITILSNIVNVYLDYLLVSRLNLGMQGAALASGIAVFLGSIIYLFYFLSGKSVFNFTKPIYKSQEIREMCYNGSSELIGQLSMSITTALFNIVILNIMSVQGVAAMTIIGYLGYIHSMIIIGIGQGMSPIISYSHGAEDYHLIDLFRKYTQRVVFVIGILLLFFIYTGNQLYIRLFTDSSSTIMMVSLGIKIYSIAFIVNGYNMIASFFFTSIGSARESAIISGMRGLVLLSLSIIILPIFFKEIGIWIAVPFTEIVTFLIALKLISTRKQKQYSLNYIQDS